MRSQQRSDERAASKIGEAPRELPSEAEPLPWVARWAKHRVRPETQAAPARDHLFDC
jgi:hypothetical protein